MRAVKGVKCASTEKCETDASTEPPPAEAGGFKRTNVLNVESAKAASPLWGNIEVTIVLLEVLGRYVFHNNLISYIVGRGGKVPSSPYMPTPELL